MMERIDDRGTWQSENGRLWLLVERSPERATARDELVEPDAPPTLEERLAAIESALEA